MPSKGRKRQRTGSEITPDHPHYELLEASRQDEIAYRRYVEAHDDGATIWHRLDGFFRWFRYLVVAASSSVLANGIVDDAGLGAAIAIGAAMAAAGAAIGYYDGLSGRGIFTLSAHGAQVRHLQAEVDVYFAAVRESSGDAEVVLWPKPVDDE